MAAFTMNVNMDCVDIEEMTRFWAGALGYEVSGELGPFRALRDPDGIGPKVVLQRVPNLMATRQEPAAPRPVRGCPGGARCRGGAARRSGCAPGRRWVARARRRVVAGHARPGGQRVLRVSALTGRTGARGLRQCCL